MAIYQYLCANKHKTEFKKLMSYPHITRCPVCDGKVRLAPTMFTFSFKGGV
ncbi:hypothetical protein LCGC14_1833760 [marine sediment metagenome]|uniref:Uncharacterized protein n=1 Tax=marine sediment metagenome TaxID=412755 RepID=A0A0F9GF91_9ZZZZ